METNYQLYCQDCLIIRWICRFCKYLHVEDILDWFMTGFTQMHVSRACPQSCFVFVLIVMLRVHFIIFRYKLYALINIGYLNVFWKVCIFLTLKFVNSLIFIIIFDFLAFNTFYFSYHKAWPVSLLLVPYVSDEVTSRKTLNTPL